jgi:hypothetical protein
MFLIHGQQDKQHANPRNKNSFRAPLGSKRKELGAPICHSVISHLSFAGKPQASSRDASVNTERSLLV